MGAFRYFGRDTGGGTIYEIYRCPANGLPIEEQSLAAVERLQPDGSWLANMRETLVRDMMKGDFDEKSCELNEEQARAHATKWFSEGWPVK